MTSTLEAPRTEVRPELLDAFAGKILNDLGAAASGALVVLGDRLGLYRALADGGATTSAGLALRTQLDERYLREWLCAQAAAGYVDCDPESGLFFMSPEQIAVFADPDHPAAMTGGFYTMASAYIDEPKVANAFRTGEAFRGAIITTACSAVWSASSDPATPPISSRIGFLRSMAWRRSCAPVDLLPTSVAGTASPRS